MIEQTRAWSCAHCDARGTLVTVAEAEAQEPSFRCPQCATPLAECRRTRRAREAARRNGHPGTGVPEALTRDDAERCAREWGLTHELLGSLGVMAESNWALDWAERLLAEIRRRQEG